MSNIPKLPESNVDGPVRQTEVKDWLTYETMSPLGRSLMDIAKQIEESDDPPMDEDAVEAELLRRRVDTRQMTNKTLTYIDASVLIYAAVKPTSVTFARRLRALQVLADPDRDFVATEYLRLEIMPIARFFNKKKEIVFYETFLGKVSTWVDPANIIPMAYSLASAHGLGAIDALHLAAASSVGAEFVSAEKPTKPIYKAYSQISSIY